jgi:hypothetical protein
VKAVFDILLHFVDTHIWEATFHAALVQTPGERELSKQKMLKEPKKEEPRLKNAVKMERLLNLIGVVLMQSFSEYSGSLDQDTFKIHARHVRVSLRIFSQITESSMAYLVD